MCIFNYVAGCMWIHSWYAHMSWYVSCCSLRWVPSLNAPLLMPIVRVSPYCSQLRHKASIFFTHTQTTQKKEKENGQNKKAFALSIRPAGWQWVIHDAGMVPAIVLAHWHEDSRPAYSTVQPCKGGISKAISPFCISPSYTIMMYTSPYIIKCIYLIGEII